MLDIKFIREHPDRVKEGVAKKGVSFDVDYLLALDEKRRAKLREVEEFRARQNTASSEVSGLEGLERNTKLAESKDLKAKLGELEFELKALADEFDGLLLLLPNLPLPDVPAGKDEGENVVLREMGEKPTFASTPRDYLEIANALGLVDTERAAKVSGTRFGYLTREAALLEFALVSFAFSFLADRKRLASVISEAGLAAPDAPFIPVVPPVLVKPEAMRAMGYVERGGDEIYLVERDQLYLVGTSEQSIGPMHAGETLEEASLPLRYAAFSSCFRREAGSYGRDTKGILRVHQFDKVELFSYVLPERSADEHRFLLALEEALFGALGIPYRVVQVCAGDLGDPAAAKFDLEAWLPGQSGGRGEWREMTSTSNTTDFQARRLGIKFKRKNGATEYVHMLNGTAFAIGRTLIAILENYQQEDGSVKIPKALQPHLNGITEIRRQN
ncbi:MAG: serine--tRNA ligase [Candidatus Sungbacteria bacterium RIFCSPLOWO2_01_FULL_59_16]|uniref:Serine--tRNA ligase n=1 Tax=Candidatus Sungbacteria bacterium RIFCSPLOWO2_01_FULL_59_16 TaxID=1802280 RepID=A0A1G2LB16_9BACT|nr:MAG: serine--tRNA ligase [Candidatus Sungbacteria bacterium RIFCSPLOWO2_01_FULL_59_16]